MLRKSERTAFPERKKPQHPAPKQAAAPAPTDMCAQWRDDSEFMLKTFSQYYPSGSNKGQTFHYGNGDNNSGSIRDDYDNPEDLWEDNQDWYEDEDEAWDEWENG